MKPKKEMMPSRPTPIARMPTILPDRQAHESLHRIVRAYDRAISACEAFDRLAATRQLGLLRAALDLDSAASRSFDALYSRCEDALSANDFVGPTRCLRSLRDAWRHAVQPSPLMTTANLPVS